jgi:hypothetical protein
MRKVRRSGGKKLQSYGASLLILLTVCPPVVSALAAQETSLTIYQDGSVLVRRQVAQAVTRGTNAISFDLVSQNVEPGSFITLDDGVGLRSARILNLTGPEAALRRSIGRDVDFWVQLRDTAYFVRGRLLSTQPFAVRIDGRVLYEMPGRPAFPDTMVQLAPRAELSLAAERAANSLRVGYLTSGVSWQAQLNVVVPRVGGGPATVSGVAVLQNRGLAVRSAEIQLASGVIHRVMSPPPMQPMAARAPRRIGEGEMRVEAMTVMAAPEGVAETRLYSVPARVDLEPGVTTTTALFAGVSAETERLLVIQPSHAVAEQWVGRADSNLHPDVVYRIRRPAQSPLGEMALPAAVWRLMAPDTAGRLQLIGEAQQGAMPVTRDVEIQTGTASDVVAERIQTAFERRGEREVIASYRVTVHNGKDESVTVLVHDVSPGRWEVLTSTVPVERLASGQFRFSLPVPARGDGVLEYRVRVRL